jgi:hypothetical protein
VSGVVIGLPTYCDSCGEPLRPDNPTDVCAECRLLARNSRLLAIEREHERQRRRQAVARAIAKLDGVRQGAPNSAPGSTDSADRV